jgi:7-cyano-7-deazaguanine synthase in queuosine biosynthesis
MRRHVLCGRYGAADTATVPIGTDETLTEIALVSPSHRYEHGIGAMLDQLSKLGLSPTSAGVDLLVLAIHVQAADTRVSRESESQDSWTRELRIVVPVDNPPLWDGVKPTLRRMLNFLTGDFWEVDFRQKPSEAPPIPVVTLPIVEQTFDQVSLFSGGLDSLIGAIDALARGRTPIFVSHAGDPTTSAAQAACFKGLSEHYAGKNPGWLRLWMDLQGVEVGGSKREMTMRGRSFLFFSAGVFVGTALNKAFTLDVPENGLIALNVPLDPLRLGSHSTRTTHPFVIARWNEVLSSLGIPGQIENPYWNRTKGEMVSECSDRELLQKLVPHSISCSSPTKGRWQKLSPQNCGFCVPCLIRRAAILKGMGSGADRTKYTLDSLNGRVLNSNEAEGEHIRSFQYALARLNKRPGLAPILIHGPGPLTDESPDRLEAYADLYRRGLLEVGELLEGVRTEAKK